MFKPLSNVLANNRKWIVIEEFTVILFNFVAYLNILFKYWDKKNSKRVNGIVKMTYISSQQ